MSVADLQAFLQQALQNYDPDIDVSPGSDADKKVVQPLLRRLGSDPFSVEVRAFIMDRLNQEFPDMATNDGDGITDLLVKPLELLLDPVVRENTRIRGSQSFRDPSTLTLDEAAALGANLFVDIDTGGFSKGKVRIYYSAPQQQTVNASNVFSSRGGLGFFPVGTQSIALSEMLFNQEGALFFFDVDVVAEKAGDQYNLEIGEMIQVAGISASVKVANKSRFTGGVQADDTASYMANVASSITERSLVTKRGIATQLTSGFPAMTRLNVVGFNDPEMERDVLTADAVGPVASAGIYGLAMFDGLNGAKTRRFSFDSSAGHDAPADFTTLIGPPGTIPVGWYLTLHGAFLGAPPVQDVAILTVVDAATLDLAVQVLPNGVTGLIWELRHAVLTLSDIPGGIVFPDGPNGTVTTPDNQIHIGGCTDIHIRGTVLDTASISIAVLEDDQPALQGLSATNASGTAVVLGDLVLGVNYNVGDDTYNALANAYANVDQFQILAGPGAGIYRVLSVEQDDHASPVLTLLPTPPMFVDDARWKLVDSIHIDLVEPKETRVSGTDLQTIQGQPTVTTMSAINFTDYGVAPGDKLQIENGPDADEYTIKQVATFPNNTVLVLNKPAKFTRSSLSFTVFRPASTDIFNRPMVRVTSIDLLDSNGQPVGSTVPYALPVGAYSTAFAHPGRGMKFDIEDALLGVIGKVLPTAGANVSGLTLAIAVFVPNPAPSLLNVSVTFTGSNPVSLADIVVQVNAAYVSEFPTGTVLAVNAGNRLGILGDITELGSAIVGPSGGDSAIPALFDLNEDSSLPYLTSFMVRSPEFTNDGTFFTTKLLPPFDDEYDVLQTLGGSQIGFFTVDYLFPYPGVSPSTVPPGLTHPNAMVLDTTLVPQGSAHIQFGSRSFGRARLYFLAPTTIELGPKARFVATLDTGVQLGFVPDFAETAQIVPALPSGVKPLDGTSDAGSQVFTSNSTNFVDEDVQPGDLLTIDYVPLPGSISLADPVSGLAFQKLTFALGGNPDINLTFSRDNLSLAPTDVSRQGVADEINSSAGMQIATIDAATNKLILNPSVALVIRGTGSANALLGFPVGAGSDVNNASAHAGIYQILQVTLDQQLQISPATPPGTTETGEQFTIVRPGVQRIGTTAMSKNVGPAGLYTADIELVSEGTGDQYDIDAETQLTLTGIISDGYYLTTEDSNLTFSPAEDITLVLSKTINEVGTDDSLTDATTLTGQNIQVSYEYSTLTSQIQNFVMSDSERVINESPLARHLIPYYVRFDLLYSGGPQPADVQPSLETLIQALFPDQQLQVSDVQALLSSRGTTSITNPLTLYGVIYNLDRTVTLEKSEDRLNVGRLAAFIPDQINLVRSLT